MLSLMHAGENYSNPNSLTQGTVSFVYPCNSIICALLQPLCEHDCVLHEISSTGNNFN